MYQTTVVVANTLHYGFQVLLGAENENILDPIEYQIKSLTRLSQHATQIQGATPTPFMIIDERRIFIIIYNIPYERTQEQIQKVKILLTNLNRIRRREIAIYY